MTERPDLVTAAANLETAKTKMLEAIRACGKSTLDWPTLSSVAEQVGIIAKELREHRLMQAMRTPVVSRKAAAAALAGGEISDKRRGALAKARARLAEVRKERSQVAAARKRVRRYA